MFAQPCPTLLQDELGPYVSIEECYLRGASIIKASSTRFPLMSAAANCTEKDPEELLKKKKAEAEAALKKKQK